MLSKEVTALTLLVAVTAVTGYGTGAPKEACGDMIPQHHVEPQTTPFPYALTVNKKGIRPGEKVIVTIAAGGKVKDFKGFFVQARVGDTPIGQFGPAPGVSLVDCGGSKASGATHAKADAKQKIVLTWTAPEKLTETVRFRVTVAENGGKFWVGHLSSPLYIKKN